MVKIKNSLECNHSWLRPDIVFETQPFLAKTEYWFEPQALLAKLEYFVKNNHSRIKNKGLQRKWAKRSPGYLLERGSRLTMNTKMNHTLLDNYEHEQCSSSQK